MCGIVGYVGPRAAVEVVFDGLKRLEYRGYDSAGIATIQDGDIAIRRDEGKLSNLAKLLAAEPMSGQIAIGHTRWATHGVPSMRNAHPHTDCHHKIAVIQNGIVENFRKLKEELIAEGHKFTSETDTEVIVHLVEKYMAAGKTLTEAGRLTFQRIEGAHAIVLLSSEEPEKIVAVRLGNAGGVTVGLGDGEMFLASDIPAILEYTRRMIFLEDGEIAVIERGGVSFTNLAGEKVVKQPTTISWDPISAAKGSYRHFMLKEIAEQARTLTDAIRGRVDFVNGRINLPELNIGPKEARDIHKICIVACGTSAYAGLIGKFMIEELARIPVEVDYGSEFRYRDPIIDAHTLVLAISQSGETVDTLAALEEARSKGARLASIVNVLGSMVQRICDGYVMMQVGPEIGVASTKAFTASLAILLMIGMHLGTLRKTITQERCRELTDWLAQLPDMAGKVLSDKQNNYQELAERYHNVEHFLFLGRGINYPIALEGALKLKEISYIHAEGYPAGEMKHGPIALIDKNMPVVTVSVQDSVYEKMLSQIEQVKSRGGIVIALANYGDKVIQEKADHILWLPRTDHLITPILAALPMQMLAYQFAVRRGADVDQPRNLAKSVTVE